MSAGEFEFTKYESTELNGQIMSIKVQPETLLLFVNGVANSAPEGEITLSLRASVSNNVGEYGVRCRRVSVEWTDAAPDGYDPSGIITLPVLTQAAYLAYTLGSTGNYLGQQVRVVGRSPERAK
jgi:hypothetical protein